MLRVVMSVFRSMCSLISGFLCLPTAGVLVCFFLTVFERPAFTVVGLDGQPVTAALRAGLVFNQPGARCLLYFLVPLGHIEYHSV